MGSASTEKVNSDDVLNSDPGRENCSKYTLCPFAFMPKETAADQDCEVKPKLLIAKLTCSGREEDRHAAPAKRIIRIC